MIDFRGIPTNTLFSEIDVYQMKIDNLRKREDLPNKIKKSKVNRIKKQLCELRGEISNRLKKGRVTDHAIVRYLERVHGLEIQVVTDHLESLIPADHTGHSRVLVEGNVYGVVRDGRMLTVVEDISK